MVKVGVDDFSGIGLYDPGANASGITFDCLKKIKNYCFLPLETTYNTTSGMGLILGITMLTIKIMNISHRVLLYVLDSPNFTFDFIIALDLIPLFKLNLYHNLVLSQSDINVNSPVIINHSFSSQKSDDNVKKSDDNVIWNEYFSHDKFISKTSHLESGLQKTIQQLIISNEAAFARHKFDVGNVTKHECPIRLSDDTYVAKKPYRCSFQDQEEIERQCADLLRYKMITLSSSPFASPVTLQYKKDGLSAIKIKTRMCVDFRELNKIIIPESHPFPLIEDILIKTRGCSWFSALDINAAFHSIPIRPSDRYKSAFVTQQGHYEWRSMPFGLKNAPAVFQRILSNVIKSKNLSDFCINYLDDILIFSHTFEDHVKHIQCLISAIYEEGFRLNFDKCNFAMSSIRYLGHYLSSNCVKPLNDNLVAIRNFPTPSSRRKIREFLGKVNFYRKFIPNSSVILEPFHNLLRKNVSFSWSASCQQSFDRIKELLTSAPILAIFDRTRPVSIFTDASGIGIGAVLKQPQADGTLMPVAYFSKKLSEAQKKKKAIYIESLAVREAIRYWRYWLIGRHFTVYSDHKPLQNLNLKARPDEELGDLANELLQFDFNLLYNPGSSNHEADCLSRNPVLESSPDLPVPEPILPSIYFLSHSDILSFQSGLIKSDSDVIRNNVIFRVSRNHSRILLNDVSGKLLIRFVHDKFGHIGSKHMIAVISHDFTFPSMYKLIRAFCSSCEVCLKNKSRRPRRSASLGILGPPSAPFEIMSLDTIGGFSSDTSPLRYLHLLVDHFSRFAYILCTKGQSAHDMISLVDSVQTNHPIGILLTDQYGGLSSKEFNSYCKSSNISHVFTAVDSAFSNGLNERLNQTLVNRIRCIKNDPSSPSFSDWSTIADKCVQLYNDSPHSVTSFPPSYLLTGLLPSILPSSLHPSPDITRDRKIAFDRSVRFHAYNKSLYDASKNDVLFNVGDSVLVDNGNRLNRDKLDPLRIGPFVISRKLSNNVFELIVNSGPLGKRLYHASKLLHFSRASS